MCSRDKKKVNAPILSLSLRQVCKNLPGFCALPPPWEEHAQAGPLAQEDETHVEQSQPSPTQRSQLPSDLHIPEKE